MFSMVFCKIMQKLLDRLQQNLVKMTCYGWVKNPFNFGADQDKGVYP